MAYSKTPREQNLENRWGRNNVGARGQIRSAREIPKYKHDPFAKLLAALRRHYGSERKICSAIGISTATVWSFEKEQKLSHLTASKIVAAYNAIRIAKDNSSGNIQ